MPKSKPRRSEHKEMGIRSHFALRHPNCPPEIAEAIITAVRERIWNPPVSVGKAIGVVASNLVRHRLTGYEHLMKAHRLTRDEARIVVAAEVEEIIQRWGPRP